MDYRARALLVVHDDWTNCLRYLGASCRYYALTTKGGRGYHQVPYRRGDVLVFGPETRGLPPAILLGAAERLRIPMAGDSRSLNLSNAVAVAVYEAWRQLDFAV
jgi:tRNA (cytidine/uridine-2'-O-)-methyltransferase